MWTSQKNYDMHQRNGRLKSNKLSKASTVDSIEKLVEDEFPRSLVQQPFKFSKKNCCTFCQERGKKRNPSRPRALDPQIMKFHTLMLYHWAFENSVTSWIIAWLICDKCPANSQNPPNVESVLSFKTTKTFITETLLN